MRRRRKVLLTLTLGLFVCGLLVVFRREKEPAYERRKLSEWVAMYSTGRIESPSPADQNAAANAIRHIGTNGLPYLLAWLADIPTEADERARNAMWAFEALGPMGAPAIPELTRLVNLTNSPFKADLALLALAYTGPDAVPTLTNVLSRPEQAGNLSAAECIKIMGTNARPLVPLLVQRLQHTNEAAAMTSAGMLGELKFEPDLVVPALIKTLQDPRPRVRMMASSALAEFGELARPALSALSNALNNPDPFVRRIASNAIARIAPDTLTNAPAR